MILPRALSALLLASALVAPAAWSMDPDAAPAPSYSDRTAIPASDYHDVYRGYLGMSDEQIAAIPWYESSYSLSDDDCLAIAIIAHAASRPFATAVGDFVGPCHRSLAELMHFYSVPSEVLFVQAPPTEVYPTYYHQLYEPYWGGYCDRVVYSNSDCCALFAFRVSTEFWRCPPPLFFDRCVSYRSPGWALRREPTWWRRPAPGFAPLPARELRRPAPLPPDRVTIVGSGERGGSMAAQPSPQRGAIGGSSAGFVPPTSHPSPTTTEKKQPFAPERPRPGPVLRSPPTTVAPPPHPAEPRPSPAPAMRSYSSHAVLAPSRSATNAGSERAAAKPQRQPGPP